MNTDISYIGTVEKDDRLAYAEQIIIFGAGKVGKETLEFLKDRGWLERAVCFCDNSPEMQGTEVQGIPVFSPGEACRMYPEGTYLIASLCVRQMAESLRCHGIEDIHIIREA